MILTVAAFIVLAGAVALAGSTEELIYKPKFIAGAGVVVTSKPYDGFDGDEQVIPLIFYEEKGFFIRGKTVGYNLFEQENIRLAAIAEWRFDGYEDDDSSTFDGMDDRDMTIDAGVLLSYDDGWGKTSVSFVNDILGKHDGQEVQFTYSKPFVEAEKRRWSITPYAGLEWQSDNLADYYYGVRSSEATGTRPEYMTSSAWNILTGIRTQYWFNEQWSVMANVTCKFYDDDITDSPIVNKHHSLSFLFGLMYSF